MLSGPAGTGSYRANRCRSSRAGAQSASSRWRCVTSPQCVLPLTAQQTSSGTCRLLLEHRADLAALRLVRRLPSRSLSPHRSATSCSPSSPRTPVPWRPAITRPLRRPTCEVRRAYTGEYFCADPALDSPELERRHSPSIAIGKLSLHSSDGAVTNGGTHYGRRGFSLVSPPQLGSSPPVRRLSSSSSAVGGAVGARSPLSPSDFGPFVGSMEESLLSGRVRCASRPVLWVRR